MTTEMLTLKIDTMNIEQLKELNFLGLIINSNLNWKIYTENI